MHAGRRDAATDRRLDSCVVYSASVKMSGAANDDDDDKAPMIVHEWPMPAATASHHSSDVTRPAGALDVVTRRRFTSLCLAIVTLILFTCALIFLVVCLIIPVMHSTAMQQQQQQQQHHNRSSSPASAADHDDEHHQHSRPVRHLVNALQQLVAVCIIILAQCSIGLHPGEVSFSVQHGTLLIVHIFKGLWLILYAAQLLCSFITSVNLEKTRLVDLLYCLFTVVCMHHSAHLCI